MSKDTVKITVVGSESNLSINKCQVLESRLYSVHTQKKELKTFQNIWKSKKKTNLTFSFKYEITYEEKPVTIEFFDTKGKSVSLKKQITLSGF
jgi:hypothetical protein